MIYNNCKFSKPIEFLKDLYIRLANGMFMEIYLAIRLHHCHSVMAN